MQFIPINFGDMNSISPGIASVTKDFRFSQPASAAHAVLQGFDLEYNDPYNNTDHNLRRVKVNLTTHFQSGDSGGSVEVSWSFVDNSFEIISVQIDLLMIGL